MCHKDIKQEVLFPKLLIDQIEGTENNLEGQRRYHCPSLVELRKRMALSPGHPAWQCRDQRQADAQCHQKQKYGGRESCLSFFPFQQ